jgi:hypothetical protein
MFLCIILSVVISSTLKLVINYGTITLVLFYTDTLLCCAMCNIIKSTTALLNNIINKTNWWNVLIWVTGHCNRAAVSWNRYGVEKTVGTHKILINAIKNLCLSSRNMIDKNHVWSFMTKYLRVEVGKKHPQVILAMYFLSWTRIMSVLIGWPI